MAFEDQTFKNIMTRMLGRVAADIDKREGSVIWNALAPAAIELATLYMAYGNVIDATTADTAPRQYLIRRAAERGMIPKAATNAAERFIRTSRYIRDSRRFALQP